jgi:hypothetical protein
MLSILSSKNPQGNKKNSNRGKPQSVRVLTGNVGLWKSSLKTVSWSLKSLCSSVSYLPSHKSRPPIKVVIFQLFPIAWVSTITHF